MLAFILPCIVGQAILEMWFSRLEASCAAVLPRKQLDPTIILLE